MTVMDVLRRRGSCTDREGATSSTLNKALLQRECWGLIHVSNSSKGERRIDMRKTRKNMPKLRHIKLRTYQKNTVIH
jgi:hypothetical protein